MTLKSHTYTIRYLSQLWGYSEGRKNVNKIFKKSNQENKVSDIKIIQVNF